MIKVCAFRACEVTLRTDVLARASTSVPPGFKPEVRVRGHRRALPQVFRPRASGSKPVGSASQTRDSNTLRNISYECAWRSIVID